MNTLRAALEHAIYSEAEVRVGRHLTDKEARSIEMPAKTSATDFLRWVEAKRKAVSVFNDKDFVERISSLQPFNRTSGPDLHPMALLAEHTNHSKHRSPSVAAVRLGAVRADQTYEDLVLTPSSEGGVPVEPGSIIASGPIGRVTPLDIWPRVSVQRPGSKEWVLLVKNYRNYIIGLRG